MKTITQISAPFILGIIMLSCGTNTSKESGTTEMEQKKEPKTTIHEATFFGNKEALEAHIAFGTDLDQKDEYGSTPLIIALTFGKNDIAKFLIESGADINTTAADGSTPLHAAALYGRTEIVQLLVEKGIELEVKNNYGSTALQTASAPFEQMKPIYDQLSRDLGPIGFKLDYEVLQKNRVAITRILDEALNAQGK